MRYWRVDLHELAAEADVDLDAALTELRAMYDEVDARNAKNTAGLNLPCHRGCSMCCEESVFLTPIEFFGLWKHAQDTLSDEELDEIIASGLAIYEAQRERIEACNRPPPAGERDHFSIAKDLRFRCPYLSDEGACRVYPMREMFGRLFGCSFNDEDGGLYACHLVGKHLDGQTVTFLKARGTARRIDQLPLSGMRQVHPWYLHWIYG